MDTSKLLRHVVLFSFKNGTHEAQCREIVQAFCALPARIPGIVQFEWGTNVSAEKLHAGFTHCFMLTFGGTEDRDAYLAHPAHAALVGMLPSCLEKSLVVDYWVQRAP